MATAASWYEDDGDLERMRAEDRYLQAVYRRLRRRCPHLSAATAGVHVYPSRHCTYTVNKRRIFVRVFDEARGVCFPECVLAHVILHELAHVHNTRDLGHGPRFRSALRALTRPPCRGDGGPPSPCEEQVPADYNTCH